MLATRGPSGRCVAERRAPDLVKLLALGPGHRMARDELLAMLWPKLGADRAPSNLHEAASGARQRRRVVSGYRPAAARQLRLLPDELSRLGAEPSEETLALSARARTRPGALGGLGFSARRIPEI